MIRINKQAKSVMDKLTADLKEPGDHREIDNSQGFMSVHVEHIGTCNLGPLFSVAHYYEQNGDLMKDPDMVFVRGEDGEYYPTEFQQDNLCIYQRAVEWENGAIKGYQPGVQKDMAVFAGTWMKNIKAQQGL